MASDGCELTPFEPTLEIERLYSTLISMADASSGEEKGLGGQLLYSGELDGYGSALVIAGNIAGAASLSATADVAAQKRAIREGVVDFLVTSLDEALRILKNEIRKRERVAVCVAGSPPAVERQMLERGVLPDILPPGDASLTQFEEFLAQGSRRVRPITSAGAQTVLTWSVSAAPAHWLPKVDAIALGCPGPSEWAARRWLRLAPRYLGREAKRVRLLVCDRSCAERFVGRVRGRVEGGEIGVTVEIALSGPGGLQVHKFSPPGDSGRAG